MTLTGQDFGGYAVTRRLANGGMTNLYVGLDAQQHRVVIRRPKVDFIHDKRMRAQFVHGAEILSRVHHPNIARLIKYGMHHDEPYMILEYHDGLNLRELIQKKDPLLTQNVLSIMRQMAAALAHVHLYGYLHLDFKPENLVVSRDGVVVLIDFDLAMERKKGLKLQPLPGTFAYLPPETLATGMVDEQTDIYSFGVTCYELLTGHKPFEGITAEDTRRLQMDSSYHPPRLKHHGAHVAPAMETMVFKCLATRTIERYPSMGLVSRDLERLV